MIGAKLGSYEVTGKLGEGGMGEVYRATDPKLKREVAIKVLPEAFAAEADRLARFELEAQVLAQLQHPNIASIYGVEESNGVRALVMELVPGEDLGLAFESREPLGIARERLGQDLDRDLALQLRVGRAVDDAHPPGAEW